MKNDIIGLIRLALTEDLGDYGDITSQAIIGDESGSAVLLSKDSGVLAGAFVFESVFEEIDSELSIRFNCKDGDRLSPGVKVANIEGKVASILKGERISLNFISFLSGIATRTSECVAAARSGGNAVILDTRKTLPGFRSLSKYAVEIGGGRNHRMGLHDMVLIKDNHIDACGGISTAVSRVRARWGTQFPVEVECRTVEDVEEAVSCNIDYIMLDNMDAAKVAESVKVCGGKIKIEASGNMDEKKIAAVSGLGVDFISVGAITKSVQSFDFSLEIEKH
jgi:nicotinate-nucleotide pyrophosphorylase (carboxylating)